jgi:hypothetical protein
MPPFFRPNFATIKAIHDYATIFHARTLPSVAPTENYVSSAFGSWLLLAVLADSTDFRGAEERKARIESILNLPIATAGEAAKNFLANISGADLGIGVWFDAEWVKKAPRISSWLLNNDLGTTEPRVPPQAEMDAWTNGVTHGLIEKFPVAITKETMFLVASVIYTKFEWTDEYDVVPTTTKPSAAVWGVESVLYSDDASIEFYSAPGVILAAHRRSSVERQVVISVTALSGDVDELNLLGYAQEISHDAVHVERLTYQQAAEALDAVTEPDEGQDKSVSFFFDDDLYGDEASVVLPAWEADNTHDLSDPGFGYEDEAETLAIDFPEYDGFSAAQAVVAKYGAKGFEAAAVTAFSILRAAAISPRRTGGWVARVTFDRPYAAVCIISGIPAFTAVIRKAVEA